MSTHRANFHTRLAEIWLNESDDSEAADKFKDMMLNDSAAISIVCALQLTIIAACLCLSPQDYSDALHDTELDAVHWLFVCFMFGAFVAGILCIFTELEVYLDVLHVHSSQMRAYVSDPRQFPSAKYVSGYKWYKLSTWLFGLGFLAIVYLLHGRYYCVA